MATNIYIPGTVTDLKRGLGQIEGLLTAKRWEKAAIVYAWTQPGERGGAQSNDGNPPLTLSAFVELGITGLRDRHQVRMYRKAWEDAATEVGNDDMLRIKPGDAVDMPNLVWKEFFGEPTVEVQERVARAAIVNNPEIVQQAVETFPAIATAAVKGLAASPVVARQGMDEAGEDAAALVEDTAWQSKHKTSVKGTSQPARKPFDFDRSVMSGFDAITSALYSLSKGTWTPNANSEQCLRLLRLALNDWSDGQPITIHDEIEDFLKTVTH
jgi:hypothetical protein